MTFCAPNWKNDRHSCLTSSLSLFESCVRQSLRHPLLQKVVDALKLLLAGRLSWYVLLFLFHAPSWYVDSVFNFGHSSSPDVVGRFYCASRLPSGRHAKSGSCTRIPCKRVVRLIPSRCELPHVHVRWIFFLGRVSSPQGPTLDCLVVCFFLLSGAQWAGSGFLDGLRS